MLSKERCSGNARREKKPCQGLLRTAMSMLVAGETTCVSQLLLREVENGVSLALAVTSPEAITRA